MQRKDPEVIGDATDTAELEGGSSDVGSSSEVLPGDMQTSVSDDAEARQKNAWPLVTWSVVLELVGRDQCRTELLIRFAELLACLAAQGPRSCWRCGRHAEA